MALIDLPQTKWGGGTGRQVILKRDFAAIEEALVESFAMGAGLSLEYTDQSQVRVNATANCKARVMLDGFPSPLHREARVDGGLSDGRYRENAAPETLDLETPGHLWGAEKSNQWYAVYAVAGSTEAIFSLKAMPLMRVSSQDAQTIYLRNNADDADIGYGFAVDELANAKILVLTGASRGEVRRIVGNNSDNGAGGTITYDGGTLSLTQGDWFVVLPKANFRYIGMILNDAAGNLVPFRQQGKNFVYLAPRTLSSGALAGFVAVDPALAAPPTARVMEGFAAASNGAEIKLAISYNGSTPAIIVHGAPAAGAFQGMHGALPFRCQTPEDHQLFLDNGNSEDQVVKITGWEE
ncbi:MAG: hypothetical protein QME75_06020 [Deltaproteobacteria bacterium]|nr:hypothetical protein [Deltaproteobacteria bacterium]